jgi:hypothetical protein
MSAVEVLEVRRIDAGNLKASPRSGSAALSSMAAG